MSNNFLMDKNFLKQLNECSAHEVYAKIIALNLKEYPIDEIQGKILSGSINIDGHSSLRRTCSLSMITQNVDINELYWGIKSKFQLYIGLKNNINPQYEDIIWFKQGVFVITDINIQKSLNNATISLQGKDKMCLLNGDVSGQVNALTDFGQIEEYNKKTNITTITKLKIKNIIREMIHAYGNEPWHNIFIKDVQDNGIELLDYINKQPLYAYIDSNNIIKTMTLNGNEQVYTNNDISTLKKLKSLTAEELDPRISDGRISPDNESIPKFKREIDKDASLEYTIAKIERGSTVGYRLTELVYPGELVANIGESITSILDKIVQMLGPFEYFYDVDGHFIFQRQETYIGAPWSNLIITNEEKYVDNAVNNNEIKYIFDNDVLVTSLSNHPNFANVKNDFTIWGKKVASNGSEIPIHMRYAIDKKPQIYTNISGTTYYSLDCQEVKNNNQIQKWDWRELIYQMALDYRKHNHDANFLNQVANKNKIEYPTGETGYEQYYTDMEGFWRTLYYPKEKQKELITKAKDELIIGVKRLLIDKGYKYDIKDTNGFSILYNENNQKIDTFVEESNTLIIPDKYKSEFLYWDNTQQNSNYFEILDNFKLASINTKNNIFFENDYFNQLQETFRDNATIEKNQKFDWPIINNEKFLSTDSFLSRFRTFKSLWRKCSDNVDKCKLIYLYNNNYILPRVSAKEINISNLLSTSVKNIKNINNDIVFPFIDKNTYKTIQVNDLKQIDKEFIKNLAFSYYFLSNENKESIQNYLNEKEKLIEEYDKQTKEAKKQYTSKMSKLLNNCEIEIIKLWNEYDIAIDNADSFTYSINKNDSGVWTNKIKNMPESLLFWIDFLETDKLQSTKDNILINNSYCELNKYSIPNIGIRPQYINDDKVKGLCFKDTPKVLFFSPEENIEENNTNKIKDNVTDKYLGYTKIQIDNADSLFTISTQGKSAREVLDEQMYYHLQYAESVSLNTIPIYYLEPNTRISIYDNDAKIYGDYIINKISISLAYDSTMSISAFKAPERLL